MSARSRWFRFAPTVLAAATLLAATAASADATLDKVQQRKKLVVGVVLSGGPFGSIDPATQRATGFNVDLAQALGRGLGVEVETVQVQPSNRIQFLQQGRVDILVASMELNPERAELLAHVPSPYYRVGGVALVPKDSPVQKWSDLKGKDVCLSQGSSYTKPLAAEIGATPKGFKSPAESLLALRGNNCAAAVHDATLLQPLPRTNPEWKDYRVVGPDLIPSPTVIWARKGENDTVAALDRIVQGWHRDGWLIETEKKNGILPPSPALVEWHEAAKGTAKTNRI
ncbi:transporter substrate-binding domain-containing protein [Ralstonia flaminis]|jgi:polar amino acid transport system substrate-binding protein|uniref:ABC transporter glutamine-binding protein GlnH n=1 Tax=Ralstonia flaminis TaxID=3058597 RepID=A0ABN9JRQ5_9RALS|nr:transporter substrate-binding domain-containing protein [Ralstonia sp. LMG 18101]CAJ0817884.1 ABC transporter glutamine-binding protein GlnH [Ralstonia sp. LMG 18101]